jgi:hypothetical protein
MKPIDAYRLRLALWQRGYKAVPCYTDGRPALTLYSAPSESGIRGWATLYENATLTGIVGPDGELVIVTGVPPTEAELRARMQAAAAEQRANRFTKCRRSSAGEADPSKGRRSRKESPLETFKRRPTAFRVVGGARGKPHQALASARY